jgi:uncharacterized protein (TIGR02301 family)
MFRVVSSRIAALWLAIFLAAASGASAVEAPYEGRLLRLAEVLGSLHYLRNLCGEEGNQWREEMEALLGAENPSANRRARLIASFNRGYRSFGGVYVTCTESASEAISRYMEEGAALAREIAIRFGD